jgi:hypothetical protein
MIEHNDRIKVEAAAGWFRVEGLIRQLVRDSNIFNESAEELNVGRILIERVPPEKRFMLDRWLDAVQRIDKCIDKLADVSMDVEDAVSVELESVRGQGHEHR